MQDPCCSPTGMFVVLSAALESVDMEGISKRRDKRAKENDAHCSGGKFFRARVDYGVVN